MSENSNLSPAPVDPTTTEAWQRLEEHDGMLDKGLREAFAEDPDRAKKLSFEAADLFVDLSKNLVSEETVGLLLDLANETGVCKRRDEMFAGAHINTTEDRAVLHTALRRPKGASPALDVDGQNVDADVREVLERIYEFANKVRSGEWTGVTGKKIETVINLHYEGRTVE